MGMIASTVGIYFALYKDDIGHFHGSFEAKALVAAGHSRPLL